MTHGIRALFAAMGFGVSVLLSGCAANFSPGPVPASLGGIHGAVHGGQQPVAGAHVYLMAAAVSGSVAGANGYGNASVSMLSATGLSDAVGSYVLTDQGGGFSITGDYGSCNVTGASSNSEVYLYATGGNSGGGMNSAIGMLAALGTCGNLSSSTDVTMNEVSTIAMGYALAGFATDATHISIPAYTTGTTVDTLAATGLANAFANATLLADTATATAQSTVAAATKYGAGAAPQTTVNTLANILAVCVNTADQSEGPTVLSTNCQSLLNTATSTGVAVGTAGAGTVAANTATAAMYIAQHPGSNLATLTGMVGTAPPFAPALSVSVTPYDLTLGIVYSGDGMNGPEGISIDALGDAWFTNHSSSMMTEISPSGSFVLGAGFSIGMYTAAAPPAIDFVGDLWLMSGSTLSRYTSTGRLDGPSYSLASAEGSYFYGQVAVDPELDAWVGTGGVGVGLVEEQLFGILGSFNCGTACGGAGIAIDGLGRLWVPGIYNLSVITPYGILLDGSPFTSFPIMNALIAIDSQNRGWELDSVNSSVLRVTATASGATTAGPYSLGKGLYPVSMVLDGANNIWVAMQEPQWGVMELSNSGSLVSPFYGYHGGVGTAVYYPQGVAVDGSGDVWLTLWGSAANLNQVVELIGASVPVVTPISAGLTAPYTPASRP